MTCYVTYDGTIKLDNHVVGHVCHDGGAPDPEALIWHWAATVNGRGIGDEYDYDRWTAFQDAVCEVERESAVIR